MREAASSTARIPADENRPTRWSHGALDAANKIQRRSKDWCGSMLERQRRRNRWRTFYVLKFADGVLDQIVQED
jgi:hypothetical protein